MGFWRRLWGGAEVLPPLTDDTKDFSYNDIRQLLQESEKSMAEVLEKHPELTPKEVVSHSFRAVQRRLDWWHIKQGS